MVGDNTSHSDFVYDIFYLSIALAKELKYKTVFYGTHDSVYKIKPFVSEYHDVTWLDYKLYDDIKVNIWYEQNDKFFTIDGDVFLYNRLNYEEYPQYFESRKQKIELIYERKQKVTPQALSALNVFNEFNPKKIVPEWDNSNTYSYCTGIIGWTHNSDFKKYFCESYAKLRNWFLENQNEMMKYNSYLNNQHSISSHIICEHLLYQLVNYYKITNTSIAQNENNNYWHLQGGDKFKNPYIINNISNIVNHHKNSSLTIRNIQTKLLENNIIQRPILFKKSKRII